MTTCPPASEYRQDRDHGRYGDGTVDVGEELHGVLWYLPTHRGAARFAFRGVDDQDDVVVKRQVGVQAGDDGWQLSGSRGVHEADLRQVVISR